MRQVLDFGDESLPRISVLFLEVEVFDGDFKGLVLSTDSFVDITVLA